MYTSANKWYCFGLNSNGCLGVGNTSVVPYTAAVENPYLEALGTINTIAVGISATTVVTASGAVYCMGLQSVFSSGTGNTLTPTLLSGIPATYYAENSVSGCTSFVTNAGALYSAGTNTSYQCGNNSAGPLNVTNISSVTLAPIGVTPAWNTSATLSATHGTAYLLRLDASDSRTFAITTGSLPAGLTMDTLGLISGTPTAAGTTTFTVTAYGATSSYTATRGFTLTVA